MRGLQSERVLEERVKRRVGAKGGVRRGASSVVCVSESIESERARFGKLLERVKRVQGLGGSGWSRIKAERQGPR